MVQKDPKPNARTRRSVASRLLLSAMRGSALLSLPGAVQEAAPEEPWRSKKLKRKNRGRKHR